VPWRLRFAIRFLLAALLISAAALKGHALWNHPLSSDFLLGSRTAELGVIYGEALLGLWLLTGWPWPLVWLMNFAVFTLFAMRSVWQTWESHASCGCFGQVQVAPWVTLLIDLAALALLGLIRPHKLNWNALRQHALARRLWVPLATSAVLLAGGICFLVGQSGSVSLALAKLRGDRLLITPPVADLGPHTAGSLVHAQVAILNITERPLRLVGGTTDCRCITTADLPVTVPPGGSVTIRIQVVFGGQPGRFRRGYWLWTDDHKHPQALAWFTSLVMRPESPQ
jgi:hypothetical protein